MLLPLLLRCGPLANACRSLCGAENLQESSGGGLDYSGALDIARSIMVEAARNAAATARAAAAAAAAPGSPTSPMRAAGGGGGSEGGTGSAARAVAAARTRMRGLASAPVPVPAAVGSAVRWASQGEGGAPVVCMDDAVVYALAAGRSSRVGHGR